LWLMPSLHGTKIIAAGATRARQAASRPAPLLTSMDEKAGASAACFAAAAGSAANSRGGKDTIY
jgi:hypothetical protein